jgi:hypothetical protein
MGKVGLEVGRIHAVELVVVFRGDSPINMFVLMHLKRDMYWADQGSSIYGDLRRTLVG